MVAQQIPVKVCIAMDCTASMDAWIYQAKTKTVEIVEKVREQHENADILVSFVGYRDYGDRERFIILPFMNAQDTMNIIRKVEAEGGDDQAEDVAHGLRHVFELDWSGACVRHLFHIADAPPHGLLFHGAAISDRFPHGDPYGLDPRSIVERLSVLGIDYTFVKINDTTDTMIEQFHNCYVHGGTFTVIDLRPQGLDVRGNAPELLSDTLTDVLTRSITHYTVSQVP